MAWNFDNSYARLPEALYARTSPVGVPAPGPLLWNDRLAAELGLTNLDLADSETLAFLAGNAPVAVTGPFGSEPIAQAYAGHQFGHFAVLGDGRAHLLGEHLVPDGRRVDIQLKGSGQTPFSRRGDGRAALGPMLREYVISEAMHALGIPTTRSLAVITTGEYVFREGRLPGAVLTRVAASHIRVGTFEYAAYRDAEHDDNPAFDSAEFPSLVRALADYTIERHYPDLLNVSSGLPDYDANRQRGGKPDEVGARYRKLLSAVLDRQAALIAEWMRVGFIHGVMNTDNMALSGETIDYGPCAFMDHYDPATVFSSIDRQGRYAYGNQPRIAHWNLARLAEALLPLLHPEPTEAIAIAEAVLREFPGRFQRYWQSALRRKLGLTLAEPEDPELIEGFLNGLQRFQLDFTNSFRDLGRSLSDESAHAADGSPMADDEFRAWRSRWLARVAREPEGFAGARGVLARANPVVIPRNHQVEAALAAAVSGDDLGPLEALLGVLARPYDSALEHSAYRQPPGPEQRGYQTFCGT